MGAPRAPLCPEMEVCLGGWVGVRRRGGMCLLDSVWVHKADCNYRKKVFAELVDDLVICESDVVYVWYDLWYS